MKNDITLSPTTISFITTNKCSAACKNCCYGCSPKKKDRLTLKEMKDYIDQSMEAYPTIKLLVLTGGECFVLGKDLNRIISYGVEKGLKVRVVTNAYWASTFKKAYLRLKELVDIGLTEINISTGDDHQEWVPYDNIVYAIVASLRQNIATAVNIETNSISEFNSKKLKEDYRLKEYFSKCKDKFLVIESIWMPFRVSTNNKIKDSFSNNTKVTSVCLKKRCTNLFSTITINPFHRMLACCGLTSEYTTYLDLGSTKKYSVRQLYEHQFSDLAKIWLYTEGPKQILDFIHEKLNITEHTETTNCHLCQICAEIFQKEQNIEILRKYSPQVFPNIMLKYSLLNKCS
jgi:MoaA/NifB/PqqE/SkfB family radical SAM enzyme